MMMIMMVILLLRLESVHLELFWLGQVDFGEESADVVSLVTLQLNHFTIFRMIDYGTITGELFFAGLDDFLLIVVVADTLHSGQSLSATTLLDPNVNQSLLVTLVIGSVCVSKGIESLKVLYVAHDSELRLSLKLVCVCVC